MNTPPSAPHEDTSKVKIFFNGWDVYRKCLDNNYTYHEEVLQAFTVALADRASLGDFFDVACGDASFSRRLIADHSLTSYTAIDCSSVALSLAKKNTGSLPCERRFFEGDFFCDISSISGTFDLIYLSLSLHHLPSPDKKKFFSVLFQKMNPSGLFLLYEPSLPLGDSVKTYMEKFTVHAQETFTALSEVERESMIAHVTSCDFPESVEKYFSMAQNAGFFSPSLVFSAPGQMLSAMIFHS